MRAIRPTDRMISTCAGLITLCCCLLWPAHANSQDAIDTARESFATIIMYHRFDDARYPATNTTTEQLTSQLDLIDALDFTVWPLDRIVEHLLEGRPLPPRTIGLSIDDAYLSLFETGWPLIRDRGFPITVFVSTDPLDQKLPDYMSWAQLRTMVSDGVTIGNHLATHPHMVELDQAQIALEIDLSQSRFMAELAVTPELFAYPYGEYGADAVAAVRRAGFKAAFGQHSGTIHDGQPILELPRFPLNERYGTLERFENTVLRSIPLRVQDVTPEDTVVSSNPPAYGFTVEEGMGDIQGLACYTSVSEEAAELILLGERRVEIRFPGPLPRGRSRVNCTMPGPDRNWRWYGRQFYTP